jgi:hypothetical protein
MDGPASDPAYINIRDANGRILRSARSHCVYLWILYQHHADKQFRTELKSSFDPRYWEMYLTMSLIFAGYEVTCPKPGPDVGIMHGGCRVWFEATTPTRGDLDNPDQVPELREGELQVSLRSTHTNWASMIRTPIRRAYFKPPTLSASSNTLSISRR